MPIPMRQAESLQEYVVRIAREKELTHLGIAARAKAKGKKLSSGYVSNIMNGYGPNPSVTILQALAVGLDEPEDDVFAAARGVVRTVTETENKELSAIGRDLQRLPPSEQKHFKRSLEMIHREIRRVLGSR